MVYYQKCSDDLFLYQKNIYCIKQGFKKSYYRYLYQLRFCLILMSELNMPDLNPDILFYRLKRYADILYTLQVAV